jgi:EF hand domain-containing protein
MTLSKAILLGAALSLTPYAALGADGTSGAASPPPPAAQTFQQLDANRDGVLSFSEAFADPRVSNNFQNLDTNADGVLSASEYRAIIR